MQNSVLVQPVSNLNSEILKEKKDVPVGLGVGADIKEKLTQRKLDEIKSKMQSAWSLNSIYKMMWYNYYKGDKSKITQHTVAMLNYTEIPIYFFTLLDILKLKSLFKYRIHYKHEHVEHLGLRKYPPLKLVLETAKVSEFNYVFAYLIPTYVLIKIGCKLGIFVYDTDEDDKKVTWWRLFKEVAMISVLADVFFYWLHRIVHMPQFYLTWHKKHHDFKYTIAMAHHWMTTHEAMVFFLPQVLPPLILWGLRGKCHVTSLWAGMWFTQLNGVLGHAGYRMPFIPSWLPFFQPDYHDYHHVDYSSNFGAIFPMVDKVFGTHVQAKLEKNMQKVMENVKAASRFA